MTLHRHPIPVNADAAQAIADARRNAATRAPAAITAQLLAGTELGQVLDDLEGIDPGIDYIVTGLRLIAHATAQSSPTSPRDLQAAPTRLSALAGGVHGNPDILRAIALLAQWIGDPASNPALRQLTPHRAQQTRAYTRTYAEHDMTFGEDDDPPNPRGLITEAAAHADPNCPLP